MITRVRVARMLLLAAAVVACGDAPYRLPLMATWNPEPPSDDFGIFYSSAGCLTSRTRDPYPLPPGIASTLTPPHAHALLWPLLAVNRSTAYWIWLAVSGLAGIAVFWRVARVTAI